MDNSVTQGLKKRSECFHSNVTSVQSSYKELVAN
jgi:hypothetical protein